MTIIGACGIGLLTALLCLILRREQPEYAAVCGVAGAVVLVIFILAQLSPVVQYIQDMAASYSLSGYFNILLKCVGVALLTQIAADLCRGCGSELTASGIETAGKAVIIVLTLPVLADIIQMCGAMLGK